MLAVGRRRTKNLGCPSGVRPRGKTWYWAPTGAADRAARKARGERVEVRIGPAGSKEARKRWAELSGYRETGAQEGTVGELIDLWEKDALEVGPSGRQRAKATIRLYRSTIPAIRAKFDLVRYGKTDNAASRGEAIGAVDIKSFVRSGSKALGNVRLAVLNNIFQHAIGEGLTVYNPAGEVVKNYLRGRTRAPAEWEVEVLRTLARQLLGLMMDYEAITGDRVHEILALKNADKLPHGIRVGRKGGKVEVWRWTPELRRIVEEAATLPGATPFPASPIFPGRRGKPFTYSGFNTAWQALIAKANDALAACEPPLEITDLHFHDLRSKVHDDAEEQGLDGAVAIGDTKAVARRHYDRRPKQKDPLK